MKSAASTSNMSFGPDTRSALPKTVPSMNINQENIIESPKFEITLGPRSEQVKRGDALPGDEYAINYASWLEELKNDPPPIVDKLDYWLCPDY